MNYFVLEYTFSGRYLKTPNNADINKSTIQNAKIGKKNILGIQFSNCGHEFRAAIEINNKEELQKVESVLLQSRGKTLEEIYYTTI